MNKFPHLMFALLLAPLLACAGTNASESSDGSKADERSVPEDGSYVFIDQLVTDGCGLFQDDLTSPEVIKVATSPDGAFFEWESDGVNVTCARISDGSYECENPAMSLPIGKIAMDADWSNGGFAGNIAISVDCDTAEQCAFLEEGFGVPMPCDSEVQYVATASVAEDFVAATGEYEVIVGEPLVSSCAEAFSDGQFGIPGTFENSLMTISDTKIPCEVDDQGIYNCDVAGEFDDAVTATIHAEGAFVDGAISAGTILVTMDCTDPDVECEEHPLLGVLPCAATFELSTELVASTE